MGMLLLWCAASIIVPIIRAEGIIAVFFPYLVRSPQVLTSLPCLHSELDRCDIYDCVGNRMHCPICHFVRR